MTPNEIKAALVLAETKQNAIAFILGVHPVSVNDVIHGRRRTPRIRAAIAEALGRTVEDIWPPADAGQKNTPGPDATRAL